MVLIFQISDLLKQRESDGPPKPKTSKQKKKEKMSVKNPVDDAEEEEDEEGGMFNTVFSDYESSDEESRYTP